jgi:Zn-dependent M16 (insulinase) family peptidase
MNTSSREPTSVGYRLDALEELAEWGAEVRLFTHLSSKAKLCYFSTRDDNKVFAVAIRTPPRDNTGVFHVLEHAVLAGSRKFPVKDPIGVTRRGSLQTFCDGFTLPDHTVFAFETPHDSDFLNLLDVHLDAILYPTFCSCPLTLRREGWRAEYDETTRSVVYRGVVYTEMKAAASPPRLLRHVVRRGLFPDTVYCFDAGGVPEDILRLAQGDLIAAHRNYYRPSNALFFFYGNGDVGKHLDFLGEQYLNDICELDVKSAAGQLGLSVGPHDVHEEYAAEYGSTADRAFAAASYPFGSSVEPGGIVALEIAGRALMQEQCFPLQRALRLAGIGAEAWVEWDRSVATQYLSVIASNCERGLSSTFREIVDCMLGEVLQRGIDRDLLTSAADAYELDYCDLMADGLPRGLATAFRVISGWMYGTDPLLTMRLGPVLEETRRLIRQGGFEQWLDGYLSVKRPVLATLSPERQREGEPRCQKSTGRPQLDSAQIDSIRSQSALLDSLLYLPDSDHDIRHIPSLTLDDCRLRPSRPKPKVELINERPLLLNGADITGVTCLDLYFDATGLSIEMMPYVGLLARLLNTVPAASDLVFGVGRNQSRACATVTAECVVEPCFAGSEDFLIFLIVRVKVTNANLREFLDNYSRLFWEFWNIVCGCVGKAIDQVIRRSEEEVRLRGGVAAMTRAAAQVLQSAAIADRLTGIGLHAFLKEAKQSDEKTIGGNLAHVCEQIFCHSNLVVSASLDEGSRPVLAKGLESFVKRLPSRSMPRAPRPFGQCKAREAVIMPTKVHYSARVGTFLEAGAPRLTGSFLVASHLLEEYYLWPRLRIRRGAYGVSSRTTPDGLLGVASYRDPDVMRTLELTSMCGEFLDQFAASPHDLDKAIIRTIAQFDQPLVGHLQRKADIMMFLTHAAGVLQNLRSEALETCPNDIAQAARVYKSAFAADRVCVIGDHQTIRNHDAFFTRILEV